MILARSTFGILRRHPFVSGAVAIVCLILSGALGLRLWINSDGGRAFVLSQIDGREITSLGRISASGLTGDPLTQMQVEKLSVSDKDAKWLEMRDISLKWTPRALLSRRIDLNLASAEEISVLRRPPTSPGESGGGNGWAIELGNLDIAKLSLAEGVAGPAAAFSVSGAFNSDRKGAMGVRLEVTPLQGLGDRLKIDARRDGAGQVNLTADATAPAGGMLATLMRLPDGQNADFTAAADGTLEEGDGYFLLQVSGRDAASMTAKIVDRRLTANGDLDGTLLPLPDVAQNLLGRDARFVLDANIGRRETQFDLSATLASGALSARGTANTDTGTLAGPVAIKLDFSGLSDLAGIAANLNLDGAMEIADDVPTYTGTAELVAHPGAGLPFKRLSGPVVVSLTDGHIPFTANLAGEGVFSGNDGLLRLIGDQPHLVTSGIYARDTGILTLEPSELELPNGTLTASGTAGTRDRTLGLRGTFKQDLTSLPGKFAGRASGTFRVSGALSKPQIETEVSVAAFSGLPGIVAPLIGASPKLVASLAIDARTVRIGKASVTGDGIRFDGGGAYQVDANSSLRFDFAQSQPLAISGNSFDLHAGTVSVSGPANARQIAITSSDGVFKIASRNLSSVATTATLALDRRQVSGPLALNGQFAGEALQLNADLARTDSVTSIEAIKGSYGPLALSGRAEIGNSGDLVVRLNADGDGLKTDDLQVDSLRAVISILKQGEDPVAIIAQAEGTGARLPAAIQIDAFSADIKNNKEGYDFKASLRSDVPTRPFDFILSGQADLSGEAPNGSFSLSGSALGEKLSTPEPARWRLGARPVLDGRLSILGGDVKARLSGTGESALLAIDISAVDFGAIFAMANLGDVDARLNGRGEFRPVGLSPSGAFAFSATSPVPGLETSLSLDLTGRLDAGSMKANARGNYGKGLVLVADVALPIKPSADALVRLDRAKPLTGRARLDGDLGALHSAALAFGHDIAGRVDASATLSGSLARPVMAGNATVSDGLYELGATGLQLTGIMLDASYADRTLSLSGSGNSAGNGKVQLDATLGQGTGQLNAGLSRLLVYERNGDTARMSGNVALSQDKSGRLVSGKLFVDEARVSLDNLPSAGPRAIDVRWRNGDDPADGPGKLRQSVKLDLEIDATRRVFVAGRGLDSEWALDLTATGTALDVNLSGKATMLRGDLDLAGRPFIFDTGSIAFDGALDTARINISADRSVNGFVARVEVSGKPTQPVLELSSTPDLPQDEILSRLLFGRSSIDLSALEAAQLASSISRLTGRNAGFDPAAGLQAVFGVDRLSIGANDAGNAELGIGQYLAEDVYLQLNAAGADGSSVEVEWEPVDQVSVTSETTSTGENKLSIRWKKDY